MGAAWKIGGVHLMNFYLSTSVAGASNMSLVIFC